MTTTYTEKESSKKKYLVPLVVIMLCLVAITGAAYAYSTSVKGNGDITGNYVALDMYKSDGEATPKYTAVANLDVTSGSFTVTTAATIITTADGDKKSYTANVVADKLTYSTILHVDTSTGVTATQFYLKTPEFEYIGPTVPTGSTATAGTLDLKNLTVTSVKEAGTETAAKTDSGYYILEKDKYYEIVFTIDIAAGVYGTYDSLDDLDKSIALFNASTSTKELQVTFTAYNEKQTT